MVDHIIPDNYQHALDLLSKKPYQIIAGGTDLMVQKRNWSELPAKLHSDTLFIFNIKALNYIKVINQNVHIGATTPLEVILHHPLTPDLLKQVIEIMASPGIRHMSTLTGNIGNASPAGDSLPYLYIMDAQVVLADMYKEETVAIHDFIIGPRQTTIKPNQMIKEIIIPLIKHTKGQFVKVGGRKTDAISKVSFAGCVLIEKNIIKDLRLAWGAVYKTIVRNRLLEEKYINLDVAAMKENITALMQDYAPLIQPINDQRSNEVYRKQVALNIVKEFMMHL